MSIMDYNYGSVIDCFIYQMTQEYIIPIHISEPLEISAEIRAITEDYHKRAVGPAAREVLEKGLSELNQLRDTLKMIPGSPQDVRVLGTGSDQIRLSWKAPKINSTKEHSQDHSLGMWMPSTHQELYQTWNKAGRLSLDYS